MELLLAKALPPHHPFDCAIDLIPKTQPPKGHVSISRRLLHHKLGPPSSHPFYWEPHDGPWIVRSRSLFLTFLLFLLDVPLIACLFLPVFVPRSSSEDIILEWHPGSVRTAFLVAQYFWGPTVSSNNLSFIAACPVCFSVPCKPSGSLLHLLSVPSHPMSYIAFI